MAVGGQLSLSSFKEEFDDQLTCGVCLDQYTNPKTLPCHHSFCLKCIERIPVEIKDAKYYIRCPTCRVDHLLPQGGANSLPNDFKINSMLDLRNKLSSQKANTQLICLKHNDPLKVYCETCDQVICRDCTISTEHNKHTFHLISECYPKQNQQILDSLDVVKHKLDDINAAMIQLDTREREVVKQGENIKEQVNTHVQQLIDNIQQSRTRLTQQVDTIVQLKTQTLATQRQQAQKLHTQLKTCQDMIEHSLKEWNQQQILAQKNIMIDEMKTATQNVDPGVFKPTEDANIQFKENDKDMRSMITSIAYGKGILQASPSMVKQPSTATLTLRSQYGSPFSLPPSFIFATLSSAGNKHSVKCPITQIQPGKYNITFTPSTRQDELKAQIGGYDVPKSPFTLRIMPNSKMRGEPVHIITGLNEPCGIAVCYNGDIVVAERGAHFVTIINKKGEKVTVKKLGDVTIFNNPRGVAISLDGHILVTDNHRLWKLTANGVCVESIGSAESGHGRLQFSNPCGVAINQTTGHIFVADHSNNRIQVFNNNLTFSHTIPSTRLLSHLFKNPNDISIDNHGFLYFNGKNSLKKMTDNEAYITKIVHKGSDPGQLSSPFSLTIHNNLVYVCEYGNNRISVFDTDGKFCHQFGGDGLLNGPRGIAMDTSGNLYVSDTGNNRIVVF